jgi:hypothetical protein
LEPVLDAFRADVEKAITQRVEDVDRKTAEIMGGAWDEAAEILDGANRQREAVAALLRLAIQQSERLLSVADTVMDVVRVDHQQAAEAQLAFDYLTGRNARPGHAAGNGLGGRDGAPPSGARPDPAPDVQN